MGIQLHSLMQKIDFTDTRVFYWHQTGAAKFEHNNHVHNIIKWHFRGTFFGAIKMQIHKYTQQLS